VEGTAVPEREMYTTPTGVHFDASNVRLNAHERDVLYAVAEHTLLVRPCAEVRGDRRLREAAERLVRMGFIEATSIGWGQGVLSVCGRLTREGEQYLTRAPLRGDGGA
jgi:hypothetical protein